MSPDAASLAAETAAAVSRSAELFAKQRKKRKRCVRHMQRSKGIILLSTIFEKEKQTNKQTCGAVEALDGCLVLAHVALKHQVMQK